MAPNGRAEASSRMFALITAIAASSFWGSDQKGRRLTLLGLRSQNAADPSRAAWSAETAELPWLTAR